MHHSKRLTWPSPVSSSVASFFCISTGKFSKGIVPLDDASTALCRAMKALTMGGTFLEDLGRIYAVVTFDGGPTRMNALRRASHKRRVQSPYTSFQTMKR